MESRLSRWVSLWGVLVLLVGFFALYLQSIGFDYVFDDVSAVRDNPAFEKPLREALLMTQHEHHQSVRSEVRSASHDSFRPFRHLSLWVDHFFFGKSASAFHAHNVLVGGVAIWLVWLFLAHFQLSPWARLLATGAFAFHPAQVESVAYISGRSDIEAAVFGLLTLLLGYRFLDASSLRERAGPLFFAALSYLLCLAQKESFVFLPVLLLFPRRRKEVPSLRVAGAWLALSVTMAAAWFALRSAVITGAGPLDVTGALSAIGRGLRQAFLVVAVPVPSSPVRPFAEGDDWVETILYGLGAVAAFIGALNSKKQEVRVVCFGLIWFPLLIGPSLVAAFLFGYFYDHYLYLPALGLFFAGGAAADLAVGFLAKRFQQMQNAAIEAVLWVPLALLGVVWISITASRIRAWESPRSLAELCVEAHPEVGRGWVWLAESLGSRATCEDIVKYYERAVAADPGYAPAWNNLAVCALRRGDFLAGEQYAKKSIQLSSGARPSAWYNYGLSLEGLGKNNVACSAQRSLLKIDPGYKGAREAIGRVCPSGDEPTPSGP